jgi:hypothetical protein
MRALRVGDQSVFGGLKFLNSSDWLTVGEVSQISK